MEGVKQGEQGERKEEKTQGKKRGKDGRGITEKRGNKDWTCLVGGNKKMGRRRRES